MATEPDAIPHAEQFEVDIDPAVVVASYPRHRLRFAEWAASLDSPALTSRTRCSEWTVADLLRHGCDVDPEEIAAVLPHALALAALVSPRPVNAVVCGYRVTSVERTSVVTQADQARLPGVPVLNGDPAMTVDAVSGRLPLEDVLSGDPDVVHRLGSFARFLMTTGVS